MGEMKDTMKIVFSSQTYTRCDDKKISFIISSTGISILFAKPAKQPPDLFSFLSPLSVDVWVFMSAAYLGVSVLLFVLARSDTQNSILRKWTHVRIQQFTGWHRTIGNRVTRAIKNQKNWRIFGTCITAFGNIHTIHSSHELNYLHHCCRVQFGTENENINFLQVNDG